MAWPAEFISWIKDWGALVVSGAAVVVAIRAIRGAPAPKPRWDHNMRLDRDVRGGATTRSTVTLRGRVLQRGPGVAERVSYEIMRPGDSNWHAMAYQSKWAQVPRLTDFEAQLVVRTGETIPPGKYKVKLKWRQLPNTSKERSKLYKFEIPDLTDVPSSTS